MSLRTKLLVLFAVLAVVPLLGIGVIGYLRSSRALENLIGDQTRETAERASSELADRYGRITANLALLAHNAEVPDLLRRGRSAERALGAGPYFEELWREMSGDFAWIVYRDAERLDVARLGAAPTSAEEVSEGHLYMVSVPILGADGERVIGYVEAAARLDSMIPPVTVDPRFAGSGATAVIDVPTGSTLYITPGAASRPLESVLGEILERPPPTPGESEVMRFLVGDSTRMASIARADASPFAVVSMGTVDKYSAPFAEIRRQNLSLVVVTTMIAATLFLVFLWRATRSLSLLTLAADEVGRGNLAPRLPNAGHDEVGRLAAAFALMIDRLRGTLAEVERSRQMAVVGEFASQISHEIRNPLTSIKLNLQTLDRGTRDGLVHASLRKPVEISLREIQRLDRVVRGVLRLGRTGTSAPTTFALVDAAIGALDAMRPSLEKLGIDDSIVDHSSGAAVSGDRALVEAAIMNILLNASEAMLSGGNISVVIERAAREEGPAGRVRVEDSGPGIPLGDRERIFTPFFSTKTGGTGLGLAIAHRTIEACRGRLWVEDRKDERTGAALVIELPLAEAAQ